MSELPAILAHLDEVVRLPGGVELIRREVLRLAISGRLVPQRSEEGDAKHLIRLLDNERDALVAKGLLRPSVLAKRTSNVGVPFGVPDSWVWVDAFSVCAVIVDGDHQPPPRATSGVPFVVIGDVSAGVLDLSSVTRKVPADYYEGLDWAHTPQAGDILYTTVGSFGIPVRITDDQKFCFQRHIAMFRPALAEMQPYLYRFLQSTLAYEHAASVATGIAQKTVPLNGLRSMPVPVPPLAEQRRIVARVDELFGLINQVAEAVKAQAITRAALAKASLQAFGNQRDRSVLPILHDLLGTVADVSAIEEAILQLAVCGRLTHTNLTDEPASVLVARAKPFALDPPELKTGNGRPVPEPYPLPGGWEWVALGAVLTDIEAGWSPNAQNRPKEGDEWGVLKVSACTWGEFRALENKALGPDQSPRPKLEVRPGDFLISRANTSELVARSVVVDHTPPHLMLSDKTLRLSVVDGCNPKYLNLANLAPVARMHYEREATGTSRSMKNVSQRIIRRTPIPLPPRAEQDRIVAVVDELMTLLRELRLKLAA